MGDAFFFEAGGKGSGLPLALSVSREKDGDRGVISKNKRYWKKINLLRHNSRFFSLPPSSFKHKGKTKQQCRSRSPRSPPTSRRAPPPRTSSLSARASARRPRRSRLRGCGEVFGVFRSFVSFVGGDGDERASERAGENCFPRVAPQEPHFVPGDPSAVPIQCRSCLLESFLGAERHGDRRDARKKLFKEELADARPRRSPCFLSFFLFFAFNALNLSFAALPSSCPLALKTKNRTPPAGMRSSSSRASSATVGLDIFFFSKPFFSFFFFFFLFFHRGRKNKEPKTKSTSFTTFKTNSDQAASSSWRPTTTTPSWPTT